MQIRKNSRNLSATSMFSSSPITPSEVAMHDPLGRHFKNSNFWTRSDRDAHPLGSRYLSLEVLQRAVAQITIAAAE